MQVLVRLLAVVMVVVVGVVYKREVGGGVLYPKLGMRHEVVDGGSGFGFFQAFVEGATKSVHDTDLCVWMEHRQDD